MHFWFANCDANPDKLSPVLINEVNAEALVT